MSGPEVVPKLLTMDELAERLGVTQRHVRRWSPRDECRS
jgi:DNA-binding transcriptional regulator YiaG